VFREPGQFDVYSALAVALFGDHDFGYAGGAGLLGLFAVLVVFLAMDERNDIGVLLDCARFAEMTETGVIAFLAGLGLAQELCLNTGLITQSTAGENMSGRFLSNPSV
jgi:hypothetical protein